MCCGVSLVHWSLCSVGSDTRGEVERPPRPVLQEVVLGTMCHVEENRLRSSEVAAEKGLSVVTWCEAAARSARCSEEGGSECPAH